MRTLVTLFAEEEEASAEDTATQEDTVPEYSFEGFEVEFSEKVALIPVGTEKN